MVHVTKRYVTNSTLQNGIQTFKYVTQLYITVTINRAPTTLWIGWMLNQTQPSPG
jgi:hypothetical protein